jgi:hypothetical protein
MKRVLTALLVILPVLAVLGSCNFILGPDKPAAAGNEEGGMGNLVISVGGAERAIAPGGTLPGDVLAALRYELTLTGPGGSTLTRTVSGGENLNMTVIVGGWRIDAQAYQDTILAGTGSLDFTVGPGTNSVQVPMNMSGPCYEIDLPDYGTAGTVQSNFTAAFAGTNVTITAVEGEGIFADGSLRARTISNTPVVSGSGTSHSFTMPASDVEVAAGFLRLIRYVREGGAGTKDGTSWENASDDLQEMMDKHGLQAADYPTYTYIVKLGAGTYKPLWDPSATAGTYNDPTDSRDKTFILRKGVQVRGGYTATGEDIDETIRKSRFNADGTVISPIHQAVLSGDFTGDDSISGTAIGGDLDFNNNVENAYHVVLALNIPAGSGTVLDGLTIKGGFSDGNPAISVGSGTFYRQFGGGIYMINASPVLTNLTICENYGNDLGGGMFSTGSSPVLSNVKVFNNRANSGGGIYSQASSPLLSNVMISGNMGTYGSGGMSNDASSSVFTDVTISGNFAKGNYSDGGGMLSNNNSSLVLTGVTISGNKAGRQGGGMYNSDSSLTLTNVTISDNEASTLGGGMYNDNSSPVMIGGNITLNNSNGGGGIYNNNNSSPVLVNVKISGNDAGGAGGGGMYNSDAGSNPVLINTLISGNKASDGGGIENSNSSPVLINVTIAGNSSYSGGGGMYNTGSSSLVYIYNSIVWGNTGGSPSGISDNSSSSTVPVNSIVQGVGSDPQFAAPLTSTPASGGDYRLSTSTSPAVNTGDGSRYPADADVTSVFPTGLSAEAKAAINAALDYDLDGEGHPRTQGGIIDMGAYERE